MKKIIAMLMITAFLLASCTVGNEDSSLIDNDSSSVSDKLSSVVENSSSADVEASVDDSSDAVDPTDSSAVEDSSEPTEYATAELIDKSAYECKVLYTDKLRLDGIFPYGNYVDSYKKFDEYNNCSEEEKNSGGEYHTIDELYNIDRAVGEVPSYREWIKKYDKAFFEEYSLIISVVECEKSIVPKVDSVYKLSNGRIDVCVDRCGYTEEEQVYHIFIEIPKAELGERGNNSIEVVDISEKDYIFKRRPRDSGASE